MSATATATATEDSKTKTMRAAVINSGEFGGIDGVVFSRDGLAWYDVPQPPEDEQSTAYARLTIHRTGHVPRIVIISWREHQPDPEVDSEDWVRAWKESPLTAFSTTLERHAYNVAFADVFVSTREQPHAPAADPKVDYLAELRAPHHTRASIDLMYQEARKAKAVTPELHAEFQKALGAISASRPGPAKPGIPRQGPPNPGAPRTGKNRRSRASRPPGHDGHGETASPATAAKSVRPKKPAPLSKSIDPGTLAELARVRDAMQPTE